MVLGEKLWEGKFKTTGMSIKAVSADGITVEFTFNGQFTGFGRAKGLDGNLILSGTTLQQPAGIGSMMGQGMFSTMGGQMFIIKVHGLGVIAEGKSKTAGLWSFMTMDPKLSWLNTVIAIAEGEGDMSWMESSMAIYEWK